jgi:hypothetical protein
MGSPYHFTVKVISRSRGQSAIAKAAYNSRSQLKDHAAAELKDYRNNRDDIMFSGIFAPKDAPAWVQDRERLFNEIELAERRKDSQLCREVEIALPYLLTDQQRQWLVTDFVRERFHPTYHA